MKRGAITTIAAVLLKTVLPLVLGVAVLIVVVAWMIGAFEKKIAPGEGVLDTRPKATAEQLANSDVVHEVEKEYIEEAVGTLKAAQRTEISSRVLAPINEMRVRAGQRVEEGDVLVVLDRRALETQLSQAEANLVAARAAVKRAASDFRRAKQLVDSRTISREEADRITEALRVAEARFKHAQEARKEAAVRRSYAEIRAPKSGTIVDRLAEQGDMARPGEPLLVLYDPGSLRLEVPVMENLAVKLKPGDQLEVEIDALKRKVKAIVDEIVPQAEAASRSFLVKVRLPRNEGLFEGMFGRLKIPAGTRRHLCLNDRAIETYGQLQRVTVINEDGTLEQRHITTGRYGMPGRLEVLTGLKAGERVLLKK